MMVVYLQLLFAVSAVSGCLLPWFSYGLHVHTGMHMVWGVFVVASALLAGVLSAVLAMNWPWVGVWLRFALSGIVWLGGAALVAMCIAALLSAPEWMETVVQPTLATTVVYRSVDVVGVGLWVTGAASLALASLWQLPEVVWPLHPARRRAQRGE